MRFHRPTSHSAHESCKSGAANVTDRTWTVTVIIVLRSPYWPNPLPERPEVRVAQQNAVIASPCGPWCEPAWRTAGALPRRGPGRPMVWCSPKSRRARCAAWPNCWPLGLPRGEGNPAGALDTQARGVHRRQGLRLQGVFREGPSTTLHLRRAPDAAAARRPVLGRI